MGKTTVSHRLDDELLAWANGYAKTRGTTRSVLLEEGLRQLRGLAEGGVPDLGPVVVPARRQRIEAAVEATDGRVAPAAAFVRSEAEEVAWARQQRLNVAAARARAPRGPRS